MARNVGATLAVARKTGVRGAPGRRALRFYISAEENRWEIRVGTLRKHAGGMFLVPLQRLCREEGTARDGDEILRCAQNDSVLK